MTNQRGQSTVEYAVVIAVIIAALLAMQIYMKRGMMGKLKESTDSVGEQFSPEQANWTVTHNITSQRTENLQNTGQLDTTGMNDSQGRTTTGQMSGNLSTEPAASAATSLY